LNDNPSPENFEALADLIASYPVITRGTHFIFVPGPLDKTINSTLPRRPLLSSLVSRLKGKIPHVHFGTNPCRIKFFSQEIVVFRENTMSRMLRNIVGVKPDARTDDLKRYVRVSVFTLDWHLRTATDCANYSRPKSSNTLDNCHSTHVVRI
jgi:DNA polymerase epsilon subunit 2